MGQNKFRTKKFDPNQILVKKKNWFSKDLVLNKTKNLSSQKILFQKKFGGKQALILFGKLRRLSYNNNKTNLLWKTIDTL